MVLRTVAPIFALLVGLLIPQKSYGEGQTQFLLPKATVEPGDQVEAQLMELRRHEQELIQIAGLMRNALLKRDIEALFYLGYHFDQEALDRVMAPQSISAEKMKGAMINELKDPERGYHCYLFDTACLRKFAPNYGGDARFKMRISILEFFTHNKDVSVAVRYGVNETTSMPFARVVFYRPSFKNQLNGIAGADLPNKRWAKDFVACDFVCGKTCDYHMGIFNSAPLFEGD